MDALGDFGGFNDALFLIFGSISLVYSSRIFKASIAGELSYVSKDVKNNEISSIVEKMSSENSPALDQEDLFKLNKWMKQGISKLKVSFYYALCFTKICCRKNRKFRL